MQINGSERDGGLRLQLSGDVGIPQASRLHAELCDLCSSDAQLLVDATALDSLDVSSIQLLMAARKSHPSLAISWGAAASIQEVLQQTGTRGALGTDPN